MTANADGTHTCDRCGGDCGNGGVFDALVVADLDADTGLVINFHFCRDRYDDNGKVIRGCDTKVLNKGTQKHWLEQEANSPYQQPIKGEPPSPEPETESSEPSSQTPETSSTTSSSN